MKYTCLITLGEGSRFWTVPEQFESGSWAASSIRSRIRGGDTVVLVDARPPHAAAVDGIATSLNWNYVAAVAAFPMFT